MNINEMTSSQFIASLAVSSVWVFDNWMDAKLFWLAKAGRTMANVRR